ncbi:winged helix-turn-helix domain-containing protein [Sphaerisporangium sp. TRM90804]|uniref:winged helix-turn-helix domain-containing protein n=1 Tax=Sphaerisporangium sp. TRM90804 TaxID=3031113 RepID=UPI00244710E7|nr:winged helix-turn-helix domain-containing protein [Sphaerisporangium sp. TRM90804]MDH2425756.1 winged helix-turn-helix domain-containing protein [Sphaerisporangium sp. TRM90804]
MGELWPDDGLIRIDRFSERAWQGERLLHLPPRLYRLLVVLHTNAGTAMSHERLLRDAWGSSWPGGRNALASEVAHLRRHLGDQAQESRYIVTVRGVGYRLAESAVPSTPSPGVPVRPVRVDGQIVRDATGAVVAVARTLRAATWLAACVDATGPGSGPEDAPSVHPERVRVLRPRPTERTSS